MATKATVFSTLVMSRLRLLYNVHVWAWVTDGDIVKWSNGLREIVSKIAKPLLQRVAPFHFPTAELFGLIQLPGPIELLHANAAPELLWTVMIQN